MPSSNQVQEKDLTQYARTLGYQGNRAVLVQNGIVISHLNQDWFEFCARLREQLAPSPLTDSLVIN